MANKHNLRNLPANSIARVRHDIEKSVEQQQAAAETFNHDQDVKQRQVQKQKEQEAAAKDWLLHMSPEYQEAYHHFESVVDKSEKSLKLSYSELDEDEKKLKEKLKEIERHLLFDQRDEARCPLLRGGHIMVK